MPKPGDDDYEAGLLTNAEHSLLNFIEQEFLLGGGIPTAASCVERDICTETFFRKCFKKADFRHALLVRGISLRGLDGPDAGRLTEEQLVAANTMLDLRDNRSQRKKLNELGITTQKWEAWLRDPVFQNYLRSRSEALLGDSLHESHLALVDRVRSGDIAAIKYFNEITGRYVPNAGDKADVNSVIMMVVEVIQRHVTDPKVLTALAEDITLIMGGVNAAKQNNSLALVASPVGSSSNGRPTGYSGDGKILPSSKIIEL